MVKTYVLTRSQWVPQPLEKIFEFYSRPENLQEITPSWLDFIVKEAPSNLQRGSLILYRLRVRGVPLSWTSEISEWQPPHRFVDDEVRGPYALWHHEHHFRSQRNTEGIDGTLIEDIVHYALPFGPLGSMAHWLFVHRDLQNIFDYRSRKMKEIFGS